MLNCKLRDSMAKLNKLHNFLEYESINYNTWHCHGAKNAFKIPLTICCCCCSWCCCCCCFWWVFSTLTDRVVWVEGIVYFRQRLLSTNGSSKQLNQKWHTQSLCGGTFLRNFRDSQFWKFDGVAFKPPHHFLCSCMS